MMFKLQTCRGKEVVRNIANEDLESAYRNVPPESSPTITWNDLGDPVVIVAVGDGYSVVSVMRNDTWYYLTLGEDEEEVSVDIAGGIVDLPRNVVLPFETGLIVLKDTENFDHLMQAYSWREQ